MKSGVVWSAVLGAILAAHVQTAAARPATVRPAPAARFLEGPCLLPAQDVAMRCGVVLVPERRDGRSDRMISLAVQVLLASRQPAHADPVMLLGGGPGQILTDKAQGLSRSSGLRDRDIILLDQRGVGLSRPALVCDGMEVDERIHGFMSPDERKRVLAACADRYGRETDLSAYSTAENAADVIEVVRALGYKQWNVLGVSYGTRLGLNIMRLKPEGLRAVILDSPYPPTVNGFDAKPTLFFDQLDRLIAGCAADAECARAYPDLKQRVVAALSRLAAHPVQAQLTSRRTPGPPQTATVSARLVLGHLQSAMYDHQALRRIPAALDSLSKDDYAGYFTLLDGPRDPSSRPPPPGGFAHGMQLSVQCNDEQGWGGTPQATVSDWPRDVLGAFKYSYGREDCQTWRVDAAAPALHAPVVSDLPVLVLVGDYDPVTPPVVARGLLPDLKNARLVVMPGAGHVVTGVPCGQALASQFMTDPAKPLDDHCVAQVGRDFHFQTSP